MKGMFLFVGLFLGLCCKSQPPSTVTFSPKSAELTSIATASLDSLCTLITSDAYLKDKVVFDVFGYFTPEEAEHNRFIGVMRSKAVIDYLVQHCGLERSHWRIVDMDVKSATYRPASAAAVTTGHILP